MGEAIMNIKKGSFSINVPMDDGLKEYSENDIMLDGGANIAIVASTLLGGVATKNIYNQSHTFFSMNLHPFIFIHINKRKECVLLIFTIASRNQSTHFLDSECNVPFHLIVTEDDSIAYMTLMGYSQQGKRESRRFIWCH
jgi:hypothetical protein